jgi:hypothetical protein
VRVTNGDSAVERLPAAGLDGDNLPWRDALHTLRPETGRLV